MLGQPTGMGALRGAAVDADRPQTVYVTDGTRVARSTSGGCAWRIVLDLARRGAGDPLAAGDITGIVVPRGRPGRVYATVAKTTPIPGTATEPVLASFDYGRSWQNSSGLPPIVPSRLRSSPANPDVMYISMHTGSPGPLSLHVNSVVAGDVWAFYASADGGRSWTRRSLGQQRAHFVPDPTDAQVVWSLGSATSAFDGPYRSTDGGVTWQQTGAQPLNGVDDADLDVIRSGSQAARIVIAQGGSAGIPATVYVSPDAGAHFRAIPNAGLNGTVASVAFGRTDRDVVMASTLGVYRFLPRAKQWVDVDSANVSPLADATRLPAAQPSWWFWRPEFVAVYREGSPLKPSIPRYPIMPGPPLACPNEQVFSPAHLRPPPPASLDAPGGPIALQPSIPSHADFRLSLPAVPATLDTYFLLDTSDSMTTATDGVVCGLEKLVNNLSGAGVDAHYGLGEFQDAGSLQSPGMRYRRDVDIGPPGVDLQRALRSVTFAGGEEPHRGALYQTATGAGLWDVSGRQLIAPHQQADYRADALRMVMMITDEPYMDSTTYEPTLVQVIDALNRRHIHHIGIHVPYDDPDPAVRASKDALSVQQLREFSRGTGTFAPAGGVDCDGDGKADVPPGAPLVCTVGRNGIAANLAQTMTALLLAVRQDGVATLRPARSDGMRIDVPAGVRVNVHGDYTGRNALTMPTDITCTRAQAGTRHTLVMAAVVSAKEVARTPFVVTCGDVRQAPGLVRGSTLVAAGPAAAAPVPVPVTEPALSGSVSAGHAGNPASAVSAAHGQAPAPGVAVAPEQRESETEPVSNVVRMLGAGVLCAGLGVLELRRRSARRAFSKVKR